MKKSSKKNTTYRKTSEMPGGEFKTISEMNSRISVTEKFTKMNSHEFNFDKFSQFNIEENGKNEYIVKTKTRNKRNAHELQKKINKAFLRTDVTTEENNTKKSSVKKLKNLKKNINNLELDDSDFIILDTKNGDCGTKGRKRNGSMKLRNSDNNDNIDNLNTTEIVIKKMNDKEQINKRNNFKNNNMIAKSTVNLKKQKEIGKMRKDKTQKGKFKVINTEDNNENDMNGKNIKGKYINNKFWNDKAKNNKQFVLNRKNTTDIDKSFEIKNTKTKMRGSKILEDNKKMRKNRSMIKRAVVKI